MIFYVNSPLGGIFFGGGASRPRGGGKHLVLAETLYILKSFM